MTEAELKAIETAARRAEETDDDRNPVPFDDWHWDRFPAASLKAHARWLALRLCAALRAERARAERAERIVAAGGRLRSAAYEYAIASVDRNASGMARADAAAKEAEADLRALGVEP